MKLINILRLAPVYLLVIAFMIILIDDWIKINFKR